MSEKSIRLEQVSNVTMVTFVWHASSWMTLILYIYLVFKMLNINVKTVSTLQEVRNSQQNPSALNG